MLTLFISANLQILFGYSKPKKLYYVQDVAALLFPLSACALVTVFAPHSPQILKMVEVINFINDHKYK